VLDLSRSMDAEDLKPSRLIRAKQKVQDILAARVEGQTGLIVFAGSAFDVVPLTTDNRAILSLLASLDTGMMPSQGSMASEGLKHALAMFQRGAIHTGSVVILCDGMDQNAIPAAQALSKAGHLVSVLAVGTTDGAPIPARSNGANGTGGFMKDSAGNIILAKVDDERLSALASAGDGLYQHMRLDDDDVHRLPGLIPPRLSEPGSEQSALSDTVQTDQWYEEGPWILLLLLPLCALAFRRGALLMLILAPMLTPIMMPAPSHAMAWKDLWQTPDQQAHTLMQQKKSKEAAEQFIDPQWKAAAQYQAGQYKDAADTLDDLNKSDALYNRGNALAKSGDLQGALDLYDAALERNSSHQDAQFNRDLVEKALKQQAKEKKPGDKGEQSDQQDQQQGDKQESDQSSDQSSDQPSKQSSEQQEKESQEQSQSSEPDAGEQSSQDAESSEADKQRSAEDKSEEEKAKEAQAAKEAEEKAEQDKEQQAASEQSDEQKTEEEQKQAKQQKQLNESDQQALEKLHEQQQLLRRIPDDPGGLLRRKFKYQYQNRQGAQKQSGSKQAW